MGAIFIGFTGTKRIWVGGVLGEGAVEVRVIWVLAFEGGDAEESIHVKRRGTKETTKVCGRRVLKS